MCLYPKLIKNPKYRPNKKNGGNIPEKPIEKIDETTGEIIYDNRVEYVPVGCGNCIECRKQKSRAWQVRLTEEIKVNCNAKFVTLTFSENSLKQLMKQYSITECNAICGKSLRLFLERYRKRHKKSLKHWFITELGHTGTERIHMHGLVWNIEKEELEELWKYGNIWCGDYVSRKTINYIVKYVTKIDHDHKNFKQEIFASPGLGKIFITDSRKLEYKYKPKNTKEWYTLSNGFKLNLPIYYRNQLYSEEEREMLWREKLDKNEIYIRGTKYKIKTDAEIEIYESALKKQQEINEQLGYGTDDDEWKAREYNITLRMLNKQNGRKPKQGG